MTQDEAKALVGKRAAELVEDGMRVGLGTGSTSTMFIKALGARVRAGLKIRCVASSDASHNLGLSLGMDVVTLAELPQLDLYIDGADEVVASAADRFVVVVDSSKVVPVLGRFPLPVEVVKMALPLVERKLDDLGLRPKLRHHPDGSVYMTDEDNFILDCACGTIPEPEETAAEIRGIVGVVEHGLFLGMASVVLVAGDDGVTELTE